MLDLKIVDEDQYDMVPVPLPGRLIVFAGPDGLMCRSNDGEITNYPAPAGGGGGLVEPVASLTFAPANLVTDIPTPAAGGLTLAVLTAVGGILVVRDEYGVVKGVDNLNNVFYDPNNPTIE